MLPWDRRRPRRTIASGRGALPRSGLVQCPLSYEELDDDVREIVELFHKALDESILRGDARII